MITLRRFARRWVPTVRSNTTYSQNSMGTQPTRLTVHSSFRYLGWGVLERLVDAGFAEASLHGYHDGELGYRGGAQTLISVTKC